VQVACGYYHTVGLKADGSVVAVGRSSEGQINTGSWNDIVQVACGYQHTVGLKADGSVVAVGRSSEGQINTGSWAISIGQYYDINGITSIDGIPVPMEVRAHEAQAGGLLFKTQSDANGEYTLRLPRWYIAYVMAIPPAGHRPMCHGPITKPDDIQV
jgi:hypothetical protein